MPWSADDATRHTRKADTAEKRRVWAQVANAHLAKSGDEGAAVREANAAVARIHDKGHGSSPGARLLRG